MSVVSLSPELLKASKSRHPGLPPHYGTRFDRDGKFKYEPGNTIVCHVVHGSHTQDIMIAARDQYLAMPEVSQLTFTPVSSLHMTLFQGIIEHRRRPDFWPADVALDTPIDEMTEILGERLSRFEALDPFKVTVTGARPAGLLVDGATESDRRIMRAWRDALADLVGYRHPDHDTYPFHITFAYLIERLEDEALPRWQHMLDAVAAMAAAEAPILELRPPAFCTFDDMNHFEEQIVLQQTP